MRKDGKTQYEWMKEQIESKQKTIDEAYGFLKKLENKRPGLYTIIDSNEISEYISLMVKMRNIYR